MTLLLFSGQVFKNELSFGAGSLKVLQEASKQDTIASHGTGAKRFKNERRLLGVCAHECMMAISATSAGLST